eukprot:93608-Chlamydomonas_euryale.AAC.7
MALGASRAMAQSLRGRVRRAPGSRLPRFWPGARQLPSLHLYVSASSCFVRNRCAKIKPLVRRDRGVCEGGDAISMRLHTYGAS